MLTTLNLLTLQALPHIGRKTIKVMLEGVKLSLSLPSEYIDFMSSAKQRLPRIKIPNLNDVISAQDKANKILDECYKHDIKAVGYNDDIFPNNLKGIPDPPITIYIKGDTSTLGDKHRVAIIGTREPSEFGYATGKKLSRILAERGIDIVSGLALGCDSAAHEGCLEGKGHTIAILAHGLDKVYPAKNRDLASRILATSGCLISEYPPGTPAMSNYFVERDRLQSGLSDAVVVIETGIKGGTMHTVKFCLEQKRILACVAHPEKYQVNNPKAEGNRLLLKEMNAMPIENITTLDKFVSVVMCYHDNAECVRPTPIDNDKKLDSQLKLF